MKNRAWLITGAVAFGAYVSMAGCGDDEEAVVDPTTDSGTTDVSVPDVAVEDRSVPTDAVNDRGQEQTGQSCKAASECYGGLDAQALKGAVTCLDNVQNGYCTHECTTDADCCAITGECKTGLKQVCSPFVSTGKKYCFLSCEPADIGSAVEAGVNDAGVSGDNYCSSQASTDFTCRSTGGGSGNRKVCLPSGGGPTDGGPNDAADASDAATDATDAADAPSDAPADG